MQSYTFLYILFFFVFLVCFVCKSCLKKESFTCDTKYTRVVWDKHPDTSLSETILPDQSLAFYGQTEFKPECCLGTCGLKSGHNQIDSDNSFMKTKGCPCLSKKQINVLQTRGGNHTNTICREDQMFE